MKDGWIKFCALALIIAMAGVPVAVMGVTWFVPFDLNESIENVTEYKTAKTGGLEPFNAGTDSITLLEDGVNTTLTAGNSTWIGKAITFYTNGFPIYLNGSLKFNCSSSDVKFYTTNGSETSDNLAEVNFTTAAASTAGIPVTFDNDSAVHILGDSNTFTARSINIAGPAYAEHLTLLNITGSSLQSALNISGLSGTASGYTVGVAIVGSNNAAVNLTGTAATLLSAFNVTGSNNKINLTSASDYTGTIASTVDTAFNVTGSGNTIILEGSSTLASPTIGFDVLAGSHKILIMGSGDVTTTGTTFNITSNSNTITITGANNITSSGTAVNLTGNSNVFTFNAGDTATLFGADTAINITGNLNTVTLTGRPYINATAGPGINISGNSNTLSIYSDDITAIAGKIFLDGTASGNVISDTSASSFTAPIYLYNDTGSNSTFYPTHAWYFYNDSWSIEGSNMHAVFNVSGLPLTGNVGINVSFVNVTGTSASGVDDYLHNTSLDVNASGYSEGMVWNDTSKLTFANMSARVGVNFTFGDNYYPSAAYYQEWNAGDVVVLNFNPVNSLPDMNFNMTTAGANWTDYADFRAVQPKFVVDNGSVDFKLLGKLEFTENIDLTNESIGNGLFVLGDNLAIAASSIDLKMLNMGLEVFNNTAATLTVYPTAFTFSTADDLTVYEYDDDNTRHTLWTAGSWNYPTCDNYVTNGTSLTVTANNNIVLPVTHFSKYTFSKYTAPTPYTPTGGGSASSSVAVSSGIKAGDNVFLNLNTAYSALSRIIVTAKEDISTILVTAEKTALPKSIEAPGNNVYQYIDVVPYKVTDASIAQAVLDFEVKQSWLDQYGYGIGDIVMMRYHDGEWQQLTTEFVKEENGKVYYRASSPGFSYFAIAYTEGGTVTAEGTPAIPVPTDAAPTAAPTAAATTAPPTAATPAPGFAAVAALAGLGAAAFIVLRRR